MNLFENLESKFQNLLSGDCLTLIREENKKIIKKYDFLSESHLIEAKNDFKKYIRNYLYLKGYSDFELDNDLIVAQKNGEKIKFLIDFDFGTNDSIVKLKILDKGTKCGISKYDVKYLFLICVEKGILILLNLENLKIKIKEDRNIYKIKTETESLFKTQFIVFDYLDLGSKAKFFGLK